MGWPALVDGYCHVERRRSWTWIKLAPLTCTRRARPGPPARGTCPPRHHLTGTRTRSETRRTPRARDRGGGRPWGGSRKGGHPDRTRVSHRRISPWHPYLGRPGYAGSALTPSPRAPGVRHPKGHTTAGAGGARLWPPSDNETGSEVNHPGTSAARAADPALAPAPGPARGTRGGRHGPTAPPTPAKT